MKLYIEKRRKWKLYVYMGTASIGRHSRIYKRRRSVRVYVGVCYEQTRYRWQLFSLEGQDTHACPESLSAEQIYIG